jgi:tRNA A37 threonylcarbamoyladenosine dehydratase
MEIPSWMGRSQLLLGDEPIHNLMKARVLVVGLGGVGGICAEMLARAGVGQLTLVDADTVEATNRNRQIPALSSTEGVEKSAVMAARLRDIFPGLDCRELATYLNGENREEIVRDGAFDYVADCIDTLSPKVYLIKTCIEKGIPLVSSMGAGGRVDPSQVRIGNLWKSHNCQLAYYVRKKLGRMGFRNQPITAVWSRELPDKGRVVAAPPGNPKKSLIGTISYMPAIFGCTVASVIIRDLAGLEIKKF